MPLMADPMILLNAFQKSVLAGDSVNPKDLVDGYMPMVDELSPGRHRFTVAKLVGREVQTIAVFGLEDPIDGYQTWNLGYAVAENHRGKNLALEASTKGIEELAKAIKRGGGSGAFYVEAVIDRNNAHSIRVAETLFASEGVPAIDCVTNTPALHFKKLIVLS